MVKEEIEILDALASRSRREILAVIWDRECNAGEIAGAVGLSNATVSEHLARLRRVGLVERRVDGNFRRYRALQAPLRDLNASVISQSAKWIPADDLPERRHTDSHIRSAVVVRVEVDCSIADAFRAFNDAGIYTRWLGVPVTIDNGRFEATLEWGTVIRGRYEHVAAPALIALRWDFDDDNVPIPGGEQQAYVRFDSHGRGCAIEVHQLADTLEHARFLEIAWGLVLGRAKLGLVTALDASRDVPRRPSRPKRRGAG